MSEKEQQFERIYKETENFERTQFVREIQMQINDNKRKDKEIERLENIIREVRERIESIKDVAEDIENECILNICNDILDKENKNENN